MAVSWLKGIHDIGYTVSRLGGAVSGGYYGGKGIAAGDLFDTALGGASFAANIAGAWGKYIWYKKDKFSQDMLDELAKKGPTATPTAIVDVAIVIVNIIDLLFGVLPPDKGDNFDSGRKSFETTDAKLDLAKPDPRDWDGDAAETYGAQNAKLRECAQQIQDLDKQVAALMAQHAGAVQGAHTVCAMSLMLLVFAQGVALYLWATPAAGPVVSVNWQLAFVAMIWIVVSGILTLVMYSSGTLATEVDRLAGEYRDIAEKAKLAGTFGTIEVPGAKESTISVSTFNAIADTTASGRSALTGMPTVATLIGLAGQSASGEQRALLEEKAALLSVLTGDGTGETLGDGTSGESTPPTLADLTAMSGQLAKISAHASQHANLVNQMMGQVQQIASMAQQGQGATAPAEEAPAEEAAFAGAAPAEATLAGKGAEAGLGAAGAVRAPIDAAAVGPEEAHESSPAERVV